MALPRTCHCILLKVSHSIILCSEPMMCSVVRPLLPRSFPMLHSDSDFCLWLLSVLILEWTLPPNPRVICLYLCPVTIPKCVLPFGCTLHWHIISLVKVTSQLIIGDPFGNLQPILSSNCSRRVRNCDCHVLTAISICPLDFETRTGLSIIAVSECLLMLIACASMPSWSFLDLTSSLSRLHCMQIIQSCC